MTRKCHVRICRRARRHNEGLSLTHPQYYHPVSICFGLAFCKYRSGVRCFWQPTSKRVLQRRTAGSAADHESIQRARTTRRRNCLNFCSFCFEETTTWPIVATPFLPSGEKLLFRRNHSRPEGFISYSEGIRGTREVLVRRFAPNWNQLATSATSYFNVLRRCLTPSPRRGPLFYGPD